MQFLSILISTIKAKFVSIWTKIYRWTTKTFVLSKILTAIRSFFSKTLSVKPRHNKDYYGFLAWLVSRKLVYAALLVLGVLSLFYLLVINPVFKSTDEADGIPVYSYDSLALRFTSEKVKIKADSGYIAYVGDVEEGTCDGRGVLYDKDGNMVYSGAFQNNMYNGDGKSFYKTGQVRYEGTFKDNIYDGTGVLMRQNGSKEYTGGFARGLKEGEGVLYDPSGKEIFSGLFSQDRLLYTDFLGRTTQEVRELYKGSSTIYRGTKDFIVSMPDIKAMYVGNLESNTVDDSVSVRDVYVFDDRFYVEGNEVSTIQELTDVLGDPYYEGNSRITQAEAVGISILNSNGNSLLDRVELGVTPIFDDAYDITSYDADYTLYLYTYRYEGLMYTFFCNEKYGRFGMYQVSKE